MHDRATGPLDKDIGTVEVGKRANLLLLREDPTQTIQAYARIVKVILGGRVLNPEDLAADRLHSVSDWAEAPNYGEVERPQPGKSGGSHD